jgi:hypothetical protein
MIMQYEWQIFDEPDGLVSVVVRMSSAEAESLAAIDLSNPAQPDPVASQATQRLLIEALQRGLGPQNGA